MFREDIGSLKYIKARMTDENEPAKFHHLPYCLCAMVGVELDCLEKEDILLKITGVSGACL